MDHPGIVKCPICDLEDQKLVGARDYGGRRRIECERCGDYSITNTAEGVVHDLNAGHKVSAWLRDRSELNIDVPELNSDTIKDVVHGIPDYSVTEKQLILLRHISRKSDHPGKRVQIVTNFDFPLAWASGEDEFTYLVKSLRARGLVELDEDNEESQGSFSYFLVITTEGWSYLEERDKPSSFRDQAFIAMSFSSLLKPVWENAIRVAIENNGYKPCRIDAVRHIDRIDAKMIREIKNSRFLVADVTEQRAGVYFEAGYAIGLGIPVIWCVRRDDLENVHFDTRQYNHIVWESEGDLLEQLTDMVGAVIGRQS